MHAKYLERGTVWHNSRFRNCTALWKGVMKVRHCLVPRVKIVLGNLNSRAFSNP
jgi:hypothetical protein